MKKKILIGSPIKQKERILQEFLLSLQELEKDELEINYCFIDDNEEPNSSKLLEKFAGENEKVFLLKGKKLGNYQRDENTHHWNENLIWEVAAYKNKIIDIMLKGSYDYLFLVDSDLVLQPQTLQHLVQLNRDIVAEIFWTKWAGDDLELPQVWLYDHYTLYEHHREEVLENKEIQRRTMEFLNMLKVPGVYEVGGLGACTLFSRYALEKGVDFSRIKNITMWGEDRHLCIRAAALGLKLHVDTHFPAYHIYRLSELDGVNFYKTDNKKKNEEREKIYLLKKISEAIEGYLKLNTHKFRGNTDNISMLKITPEVLKNKLQMYINSGEDFHLCYPQVIKMENHQGGEAIVKLELINTDADQYKHFLCYIYLSKNVDWIINDLSLEVHKQEIVSIKKENQKKVTLVYTPNNASNIITLYRRIPRVLKRIYEFELIEHQLTDDYIRKITLSDIVVITEDNYLLNKKKFNPSQIIISLSDGFPLEVKGFLDKNEKNINNIAGIWSQINYAISYSDMYNKINNECIKINPNKYMITGQPRNDLLAYKENRDYLFRLLKVKDKGKKIIFYIPLLKYGKVIDGNLLNVFNFEMFNSSEFEAFLQKMNCEIIVKVPREKERHIKKAIEDIKYAHLLTDEMLIANGVDLYELLGMSDVLITDYSRLYFDYLLLNKPIIFNAIDYKELKLKNDMMFTLDEEWIPGPRVLDQVSVQNEIMNALENTYYYEDMRRQLKEKVHQYQDFNSSYRVWELIESLV
ncbi:CDP-glycerol glycerophosphotransferase family protein [Bacillus mobilis]